MESLPCVTTQSAEYPRVILHIGLYTTVVGDGGGFAPLNSRRGRSHHNQDSLAT
jgi:hypothetical protein